MKELLQPFREAIESKVKEGLSAQRIWQDMGELADFSAGYESAKRFVRGFAARLGLPFRRMESPPGKEAQIDFGQGRRSRTKAAGVGVSFDTEKVSAPTGVPSRKAEQRFDAGRLFSQSGLHAVDTMIIVFVSL